MKNVIQFGLLIFVCASLYFLSQNTKSEDTLVKDEKSKTVNLQLTINQPELVQPGFTLFPISGPEIIQLLDKDAEVVHEWLGIDVDRARLLKNCNLLVLHGSKKNLKKAPWKDLIKRVSEYDWQGNLVWSYSSDYHIHHEVRRLENGNTLLLLKVPIPQSHKTKISDSFRKQFEIIADVIIEITPEGETVWQWNSWEHIDVNDCGSQACLGSANRPLDRREKKDITDWTHINTLSVIPENKWYDGGDQRFRPGNLIVLPRNFWEIMIIDRETGAIVWRYNGDYKGGLVRGHEASMIPKGLAGAGNIIVLDNGFDEIREETYILEINPQNAKIEWFYDDGHSFYTRARGSVQRLTGGNTLITEDREGRVFEVTPNKEKVWEIKSGELIIRPHRYPLDHCPEVEKLSANY